MLLVNSPDSPTGKKNLKILVIRFSSLGDLVLTTPVFRELKKVYPFCHLTFLTSTGFGAVIDHNPHIDEFLYFDRKSNKADLEKLIQHLKEQQFDIVYDAHQSLRSRWICWHLCGWWFQKGKPERWKINKHSWQRNLLIYGKINLMQNPLSQRERLLHPLQQRSSLPLNTHTELFPGAVIRMKVSQLLQQRGISEGRFLCIGPSASFPGKCWPLSHYQTLIEWLLEQQWQIVLVGGKGEAETQLLKTHFGEAVQSMAGELSPLESAALLERASLVICNDTSIGHLAEAVKTPAVVIFGPTVREWGYGPFLQNSMLMEMSLPCRPCTRNGKGNCKIPQKRLCLTSLSPQMVYEQVRRIHRETV